MLHVWCWFHTPCRLQGLLSIPWFRALCNEISVVVVSRSCLLLHCQGPQDVVFQKIVSFTYFGKLQWCCFTPCAMDGCDRLERGIGAVDEASLVVGPRLTIRRGKYVFSHFFWFWWGKGGANNVLLLHPPDASSYALISTSCYPCLSSVATPTSYCATSSWACFYVVPGTVLLKLLLRCKIFLECNILLTLLAAATL